MEQDQIRFVQVVNSDLEPPMKIIAASEARKSFASVIDDAAREPVVIQRQQRNVAVMLPMQECERLASTEPRRVPALL
jgi:PHD/YefM family antitoxin component YafN of YafNO toxin-antitoxin module